MIKGLDRDGTWLPYGQHKITKTAPLRGLLCKEAIALEKGKYIFGLLKINHQLISMSFPLCHIKVPPTLHTKRHININMNDMKLSFVATYPAWCNR
jgi:hypothetical protein